MTVGSPPTRRSSGSRGSRRPQAGRAADRSGNRGSGDPAEESGRNAHAYHATRADLLRRLGRSQKSRAAYDKAIELAGNTAETAYLTRRRDQLG